MDRAWALLKTTLFAASFIAFFVIYLPWTWAIRGRTASYEGLGSFRLLALVPLLAGSYIALYCVFAFAWTGIGTPAPFDPPRRLVISGFYRYVRNPMYIGASLVVIGETALWGSLTAGLQYLLVFASLLALFVVVYEEPALRSQFGAEYEEYCRSVPRFVPRLTPWERPRDSTPEQSEVVPSRGQLG